MDGDLPEGFYDSLVTRALRSRMDASGLTAKTSKVDTAELADLLAQHVRQVALAALDSEREAQRVELADNVVSLLGALEQRIDGEPHRLTSLLRPAAPGSPPRYTNPP